MFSYVVRHTSIGVLLALTTNLDVELKQMDVKTTFLQKELDEEILYGSTRGIHDT